MKYILILVLMSISTFIFATDYQRFLWLSGTDSKDTIMVDTNSLNNRSDFSWNVQINEINIETTLSYNTAYDRSELSDGAWWQGRGFNGFISPGCEASWGPISVKLQPDFWYSQNLEYDIVSSPYGAYTYIFTGIDYPQRMGNEPVYDLGLGQSMFRLNWWRLSIGFGTENITWGFNRVNSLLMSDNAAGFPHIDLYGYFEDTTIGRLNLGNFEFHSIWGRLEESQWFDEDYTNNYTFLTGFTGGWELAFLPGFAIGAKWSLTGNWSNLLKDPHPLTNIGYPFSVMLIDNIRSLGQDSYDQKGSFSFRYHFPEVGFNIYYEYFREDYSPDINRIVEEPGHASAYTMGVEKTFLENDGTGFSFSLEWNQLTQSRNYLLSGGVGTYYTHHRVSHGYTNKGQMLGAGIGPGSDCQIIELNWYLRRLKLGTTLQRIGWNRDYIFSLNLSKGDTTATIDRYPTEVSLGFEVDYPLSDEWNLYGELLASYFVNYNYVADDNRFNLYTRIGVFYSPW